MYIFVSAIGKSVKNAGRWEDIPLGDMLISDIPSLYQKVKVVLSNPFIDHQVGLDLDTVQNILSAYNSLTFNQFLVAYGSKALPTVDTLWVLNKQYVTYCDGFQAGYAVEPANPNVAPDAQLPVADKKWLFVSRPNTDMLKFFNNVLVSVNGFFHFTEGDASGCWIEDGMVSSIVSNEAQIGFHNFQHVGSIRLKKITPDMIYKRYENQVYRDRMCINVGEDVTNQSVGIVIGGYLHLLDDTNFYRVGDKVMEVKINNLPLIERYHESMRWLDLSSLPMERTDVNDSQVAIDSFYSDANLVAYMTLSQSFLVFIDNTELFIEREGVKASRTPGLAVGYKEPKYPLIGGVGHVVEYWTKEEDGQYALTFKNGNHFNRMYNTVRRKNWQNVGDECIGTNLASNGPFHFLMIGTDVTS